MSESYNLPVQYTEEERTHYAAWGIKKRKVIRPFTNVIFLIDFLVVTGTTFYLLKHSYHPLPHFHSYNNAHVGSRLVFLCAVIIVLSLLLLKVVNMIFAARMKKPRNPRMLRLEPCVSGVKYQLFQDKKSLCGGTMPWPQWETVLCPETNQIWIEDQCLTIGTNTIASIYPKEYQEPWMDSPSEKFAAITDLTQIRKNIDQYRAFLQEQQREADWANQNQSNL